MNTKKVKVVKASTKEVLNLEGIGILRYTNEQLKGKLPISQPILSIQFNLV